MDVWDSWDKARATPPPLLAEAASLPPPERIPPREWLYGTRLVRRFVSVLAAPGGAGKSALALAQAVALATGKPLLGERVHHSVPAWVLNLEDPLEEMNRRVAALLRLHGLDDAAVAGRLFLHSGRARKLCMAEYDEAGGYRYPDQEAVIAAALAARIGLIVVDPFVKSHALDENSNPAMDAAATAWAQVAERTGAAVLLVHHVRKLGGGAMDIEATRGAKALTDAARSAAMLSTMPEEDAERLGIPPLERWRYLRLDDAKANMAPRAEQAQWLRLESVALGNTTALYPSGDMVGALSAWKPPSPFAGLDAAALNRALDDIAAGPEPGAKYPANRSGRFAGATRWAGLPLQRQGASEADAARILSQWLRSGLLEVVDYRDPIRRKPVQGVQVIDAKRP